MTTMTDERGNDVPVVPAMTEDKPAEDWRSERERNGWCRCGKREDESSLRCEWHAARAERAAEKAETFWNGMPTPARRGTAIVADDERFPAYWAREMVGRRIPVVEVMLDGVNFGGGIDYLDDRRGDGWLKVTEGRGSARYGHASLEIVEGSFEEAR